MSDVWTTLTLGKHPNARDCCMIENVPEIMAWLATIDARTADTNTGQYNGPEIELNNNK